MMTTEIPDPAMLVLAAAFGLQPVRLVPITAGLINATYRLETDDGSAFILQQMNERVFPKPQLVQENYGVIVGQLSSEMPLPTLVPTLAGGLYHEAPVGGAWRVFSYVPNSYSPTAASSAEMAYTVAHTYGQFSQRLQPVSGRLHTILPDFHNLTWRMQQLQQSVTNAAPERLRQAKDLLDKADQFSFLEKDYARWAKNPFDFPLRVLHHDCKASNILFERDNHRVLCPIDLDTTQPGLFFSDLGDMIRSMVPTHDEHHANLNELGLQESYLQAILDGYLAATHTIWTMEERAQLPKSGAILLYMQAIRFLADFLNQDLYYPIQYPDQNLVRAANQFRVLELLWGLMLDRP